MIAERPRVVVFINYTNDMDHRNIEGKMYCSFQIYVFYKICNVNHKNLA